MADTPLKTVRARKIIRGKAGTSSTEKKGEFDLKVSLYKDGLFNNKRKVVVTDSSGNKVSGKDPLEYSTNGRYSDYVDIDFITDYLDTQAKLQDGGATTSIGNKVFPVYQILQDPWESNGPLIRDFGYEPYYLNNGVRVEIYWFYKKKEVIGTQSDIFTGEVEEKYKTTYIPDGGTEWCNLRAFDSREIERDEIIRGTTSDLGSVVGKKIDKWQIHKTAKLIMPNDQMYCLTYIPQSEQTYKTGYNYDNLGIVGYSERKRYQTITSGDDNMLFEFADYNTTDIEFLRKIKDVYILQLTRKKFIADRFSYDLELCDPDYDNCKLIKFKDPIKDIPEIEPEKSKVDKPVETTDGSKTNAASTKIKINAKIPDDFKAMANKDMPPIKVFVGDIPADESGSLYREEEPISEEELLDDEYSELPYSSEQGQVLYNLSLDIGDSEGQESEAGAAGTGAAGTGAAGTGAAGTGAAGTGAAGTGAAGTGAAGTGAAGTDGTGGTGGTGAAGADKSDDKVSKSTNAGGTGNKRFQQQKVINGKKTLNGEVPKELLAKNDFSGHKFERNAVVKLNLLNKAYKEKWGTDLSITDGYRPFNVQNDIHDWDYFDTGINPYTGKTDEKGKGRKVRSFTSKSPKGVAAAKPGTSAHGWGQAMDIGGMGGTMPHPKTKVLSGENTPNGYSEKYIWMWENGPKYDWVNPFWAQQPGPGWEPWHWEYIGKDLFK